MLRITACPSCGSPQLQQVRKDLTDEFHGEGYVVPQVEFYECPDCGERLYDRAAMRKIEAYSPAFANPPRRRHRLVRKTGKRVVEVG